MKPYEKYKDSGIRWIGHIPEGWKISKIGNYYNSQLGKMLQPNAKNTEDSLEVYLSAINVKDDTISLEPKKEMWFSNNEKMTYEVVQGDLIIVEGGDVGASQIYEFTASIYIQNALHRVRANSSSSNRFLHYWLKFAKQIGYMDLACNKATIAHYTKEKLLNTPYIVIPIEMQQKIADYLDKKTSAIDSLIANKQKMIELLKEKRQVIISETVTKGLDKTVPMKDSDIPWIGEIPEDWNRTKLKNTLAIPITDGPHETPEILDDGIPFISAEAIKNFKIDFGLKRGYISYEDHLRFIKKCKPKYEDIFMIKSGATTGNIAMVKTHDEFSIWSPLALMRVNKNILTPYFLFYYLQSKRFRFQVEQFWTFGTQQNIGMGILGNLYLSYPKIEVQQEIVDYLDTQTSKIDTTIADITDQIEKLKEYRQAIISEVVTGKVMV